jgi:CDP-diacylglycerol--serine O-phosphatidyltransferase
MRSILPNSLTLSNLFCGCMALLCIFNGNIQLVPLFWIIALVADYLDGFVARLMRVSSDLGKELDSLADMVSFGVVPGALFFYMLNESWNIKTVDFNNFATVWGVLGFIVTLFSCLRLAKFNLDDRQADTFIGLNTPSCTTLVLGLSLIAYHDTYELRQYVLQPAFLLMLTGILSYLLVSEVPMFSFKFKNLKWRDNRFRISFIFWVLALALTLPLGVSLALIIMSYIVFSLILWALGYMSMPKSNK